MTMESQEVQKDQNKEEVVNNPEGGTTETKEETKEEKVEKTDTQEGTKETSGEKIEEGADKHQAEGKPDEIADPDKVLLEKAASYFPDQKFEDPVTAKRALIGRINEMETYVAESKTANQRLLEVFDANEELSSIVREVADGVPFIIALAKHFSPDELTMKEGDPGYDKWKEAGHERIKNLAEQKKVQDEIAQNLVTSRDSFESFKTEKKLDEPKGKQFAEEIDKVLYGLYRGLVTKELLEHIYKGMNYDTDLAEAKKEGEVVGKNTKIEEKKAKPKGDGLPEVQKTIEQPEKKPEKKKTTVDRALDYTQKHKVL